MTTEEASPSPASSEAITSLDISDLIGSWLNTDRGSSGGILKLVAGEEAGRLKVRVFGVGKPEAYDWGEQAAAVYANPSVPGKAYGFEVTYHFGFLTTHLSAYHKQGILVMTTSNLFTAPSGRADYWTREFFHREEG